MIRADYLKSMVDSAARVLAKTDAQVVGIKTTDGLLEVFTTGQISAIRLRSHLDGTKRCENFICGVDVDVLSKILSGCGASEIDIGLKDDKFTVNGVVNAKIPTHARNPEIKIETQNEYVVDAEWLRRCCILTGKFSSKEKGRYSLNVGHFEFVGTVATFVATDGRKGCFSDDRCRNISGVDVKTVNVPRQCIQTLAGALPPSNNMEARISVGLSGFKVQMAEIEYWCLQQEGQFPEQWREIFPKSGNMVPIDGKHLGKFSSIMDALEVLHARFVSDGQTLRVYGKSTKVPEIDTKVDAPIEPCEMLLSPELLAGAMFDSGIFQFGWGTALGSTPDSAVLSSPPFTAFALSCVAD